MDLSNRLSTFLTLAMMVFLGFYIFGLVMGVYTPGEVLYFTIPAILFAVLVVVLFARARRNSPKSPRTAEARHLRETRGF